MLKKCDLKWWVLGYSPLRDTLIFVVGTYTRGEARRIREEAGAYPEYVHSTFQIFHGTLKELATNIIR